LVFIITVLTEILEQFADDEKLHAEWAAAKLASKKRLAKYVLDVTGVMIDPNSLFDIQIKRIHEYKRQLLNILGAVYRYKKLKVWLLRFTLRNKILDMPCSHFESIPMNHVGNECRREAEGYTTHCHARRESICNIYQCQKNSEIGQ
jgi:hypothetical protein